VPVELPGAGPQDRPQMALAVNQHRSVHSDRTVRTQAEQFTHISQTSSPGARIMGRNGRRSAKRAVIRTARSARTLSAICPLPLLRIDPQ
jgi:hypothetical protein